VSRPACSWHQQKSTPIQKKMASLSAPRVREIKRMKRRLLFSLHSRAPRPPPPPLRGVPRPFPSPSCIGALPFVVAPKSAVSFLLLTSVPPSIDGATGAAVSPAIAPGDAAHARCFRARAGAEAPVELLGTQDRMECSKNSNYLRFRFIESTEINVPRVCQNWCLRSRNT